jgi:two-component sensor histidine kinase
MLSTLHASVIEISTKTAYSILEHAEVYFDKEDLTLQEIINEKKFTAYTKPYINRGVSSETIWISFSLKNDTMQNIEKILVLTSPLIEHLALYNKDIIDKPILQGVLDKGIKHSTIFPYFTIKLAPQSSKKYYLKIKSLINPIDFGLLIYNKKQYIAEDQSRQFINILLVGMVLVLMLYSFILSFYTKDKSYLYYSFYLFALISQQLTYLGLTQIYFPPYFVAIDLQITVFKITLLIITAALFSMHFLKTKNMSFIHKGYKLLIAITFIEMIILSIPKFYNLNIVILTGTIFIVYNLYAGNLSYRKGNKQARLFNLGFGIVFISYILIILNAIGLTSIMQKVQNILMIGTALEAFILSLAFIDRYAILQKEKEKVDTRILDELKNRTDIIKREVIKKTEELKTMVETRELLIKEIHHRVKNNLQVILSMVRLENDFIEQNTHKQNLNSLENRINAIAKTYDMLIIKENLEEIDIAEYIESLIDDIQECYPKEEYQIRIEADIRATLPLRESIYIGLIINEMVTNTYKYAFDNHRGHIDISLRKHGNEITLIYQDDGKGFDLKEKSNSLGLKLIHRLIHNQLKGSIQMHTTDHIQYVIRFTL